MFLKSMELRNFKGTRSLDTMFVSKETFVTGDNGTGKSTIMNAYLWLLTGKDSEGRADYEIKPNGVSGVLTSVSAVFVVDGKDKEITRTYKEKWTKGNGSLERRFTGHTTEFEIDGFTTKKSDFTKEIASIFGNEIDLVSSPLGFTRLNWKKLREILLKMAGIGDADFGEIEQILKGKTPDEMLKSLKTTRRLSGEKRESILAKIEERLTDIDPAEKGIDIKAVDEELSQCNEAIGEIRKEASSGSAVEGIEGLSTSHIKAEQALGKHIISEKTRLNKEVDLLKENKRGIERSVAHLSDDRTFLSRKIKQTERGLSSLKESKAILVADYGVIKDRKASKGTEECLYCGQGLPEDKKAEFLEIFNTKKAADLKDNIRRGKAVKEEIENSELDIINLTEQLNAMPNTEDSDKQLEEIHLRIKELSGPQDDPKLAELEQARETAKQAINEAIKNRDILTAESRKITEERLSGLQERIDELKRIKMDHERSQSSTKRVEDLRKESLKLEEEYSCLSGKIFAIEEAVKKMLTSTSEAINGLFEEVDFTLFETQINGGYKETCEPVINGIPFGSANTGSRVRAGVEIAFKLQDYFDKDLPIWIDNRESVVSLPDIECQTINLKVVETQKKLKISNIQ